MKPTSFKQYIAQSLVVRAHETSVEHKELIKLRKQVKQYNCKFCEDGISRSFDEYDEYWICKGCDYKMCDSCKNTEAISLDDDWYCRNCVDFKCANGCDPKDSYWFGICNCGDIFGSCCWNGTNHVCKKGFAH
jgi:hypothetical protein